MDSYGFVQNLHLWQLCRMVKTAKQKRCILRCFKTWDLTLHFLSNIFIFPYGDSILHLSLMFNRSTCGHFMQCKHILHLSRFDILLLIIFLSLSTLHLCLTFPSLFYECHIHTPTHAHNHTHTRTLYLSFTPLHLIVILVENIDRASPINWFTIGGEGDIQRTAASLQDDLFSDASASIHCDIENVQDIEG